MDSGTLMIVLFIGAILIGLIVNAVSSSNKAEVVQSASGKIDKYGIQQSIIKQSPSRIYNDMFSMPQGVLVLTWDTLYFMGSENDIKIPVQSIRSTSTEKKSAGTNMILTSDSGEYRFYWDDERRTTPGIAAVGDGFAAGMGLSQSANPNVLEWIHLIDDLRFGRIRKPT